MAKKTATPAPDLFATATVISEKPKGKKTKDGVESGPALAKVAAIDFIKKSLEGVRSTYEGMLKDEMFDRFLDEGLKTQRRPDSYRGVNGLGEASCELRQRSSASALSAEELEELQKAKIQVKKVTIKEEAYIFNSEIITNPELRAKVSKALSGIDFGDLQPILKQNAEVAYVASPEAIEQTFKDIKDSMALRRVASMLVTLAVKTKWNGGKQEAYGLLAEDLNTK